MNHAIAQQIAIPGTASTDAASLHLRLALVGVLTAAEYLDPGSAESAACDRALRALRSHAGPSSSTSFAVLAEAVAAIDAGHARIGAMANGAI